MGIIQNKIITIYWPPWSGKTMITEFFVWYFYMFWAKRIYSNVEYKYKNRIINKKIKDIKDLDRIKFAEDKWLAIIDEWWLNINSRRSMSSENLEYAKLGMLWRKKNVDIVIVAQLDYSIDKYFRDLSFCSIYMESFFYKKDYLMFEGTIYKKDYLVWKKEFDLFYIVKNTNFSYNTLEESMIWNKDEEKKKKMIQEKHNKKNIVNEEIEKKIIKNILEQLT